MAGNEKRIMAFKKAHDLEKRKADAALIREKYPNHIPVIVEKAERSNVCDISQKKFIVPSELTVGQFVHVIRRRMKLTADKALFVFVNNVLPPTAALMSEIDKTYKDEDGYLYIIYGGESTFGFTY